MHYLVTGGCGFIGSHLVDRLLAGGHSVTVIDNLSSGLRDNIRPPAKLQVADITTPHVFDKLLGDVDGCFHLAAIVSVQKSFEQIARTHQVNCGGFVALLDALAKHKRKLPVVFASSAAVYGDNSELPLGENSRCSPISMYGVDKMSCEWHACITASLHQIPNVSLRFFNVYGRRQHNDSAYAGVITTFMNRMRLGLPITIYGNGSQSRDFIHVDDVVTGIMASMQKLESGQVVCGVYNLCTGIATTVNGLVDVIAKITGTTPTVHHGEARMGDIQFSLGDPRLSRKELGLADPIGLEEGLSQMINKH